MFLFFEKLFKPRRFKFVCFFVGSFVYSFIHSLTHSFIHSFVLFLCWFTWKWRSNVGGAACLQLWVLAQNLNKFILEKSCAYPRTSSLNKTIPNGMTETTVDKNWNISKERDKSVRIPKKQMTKLGGFNFNCPSTHYLQRCINYYFVFVIII